MRCSTAGADGDNVGLGNVDARLRQVYGDDFGLVVETAPGAGHQGVLPGAEVCARRAPHHVESAHAWPALRRPGDAQPAGRHRRRRGCGARACGPCAPSWWTTRCRRSRSSAGCCARTTASPRSAPPAVGAEALRALEAGDIDVVFSDISMPGLDGMDLARVIARFTQRPQVVFVTAHDQHAVDAFAIDAVDYVMKPVRADRLAEAVRRVVASAEPGGRRADEPGGRTAARARVTTGRDHPRRAGRGHEVHLTQPDPLRPGAGRLRPPPHPSGSHLVRIPLSTLEERWAAAGFVRIHRSTLVSLSHVKEVRMEHGRCSVVLDEVELQVSRRHTRELRDRLLRPGARPTPRPAG